VARLGPGGHCKLVSEWAWLSARVTRLVEFRQLGDCFLWAVFLQKKAEFLGYFFPEHS
jgi:hypothetical protein